MDSGITIYNNIKEENDVKIYCICYINNGIY